MLSTPTPFPHVGSFALFIDRNLPPEQQRAEMVRVMARGSTGNLNTLPRDSLVTIAFPNRIGATGTKNVPALDLIDATPLTKAEERELADGLGYLRGRSGTTPRQMLLAKRCEALRQRAIWSTILESELAVMRAREARADRRAGGSIGRPLPRDAEQAA